MKFAGLYGIFIGLLMVAQWIFFIATGQAPELQAEPIRIAFHLVAEFITAAGLFVSGLGLLRSIPWASKSYPVFAGMLIYSVIVSPGYFAQQGQWGLVGMFAVLLVLAITSVLILKKEN